MKTEPLTKRHSGKAPGKESKNKKMRAESPQEEKKKPNKDRHFGVGRVELHISVA